MQKLHCKTRVINTDILWLKTGAVWNLISKHKQINEQKKNNLAEIVLPHNQDKTSNMLMSEGPS